MKTIARSRFLELGELNALGNRRFTTRHRIEGSRSGRHVSRQQGGAGEFVDYREYAPGEDLRRFDWRVLARTGRSYVRIYREETNLSCTMFVDASRSMLFGSASSRDSAGSKLEYAQYFTTALSHIICTGGDQVGLALASSGLREFIGPGSTPGHVARIHEVIENISTDSESKLADALREMAPQLRRRGVLLLVSDFIVDDLASVFSALRLYRHRKWDILLLHLVHPQEEDLPPGVAFRFEGLENEGSIMCSPSEVRTAYRQRFAAHQAAVRTMALADGCDYRRVSTAIPYLQLLGSFLVERAG